ncbi:hypothetical protein SAMN04487776_12818 [Priestia megaterium]|nr:hypothetical protein SAMN04487776_12818 [Priestia megaterium]
MKTVSTKHIKKLQENTKIINIYELIHSKKYTFLVTIMPLSGTQPKKEPLVGKDSSQATISALCSFLYILDVPIISLQINERKGA